MYRRVFDDSSQSSLRYCTRKPWKAFASHNRQTVCLGYYATADEAALITWCRDRLAHYKCPTSIEVRDELARTATGKLQKFKLRAPYWEGRDRLVN